MALHHQPEIDLLIVCAHPDGKTEPGRRIRSLLGGQIDWARLRALAYYHRVEPIVYTRLTAHAVDRVPSNHLATMAEEFRAGATRNLQLTGELIALTKAFAKAEIPVLPHKGPLLAQAAYGDLAMRQFADLDLLVHQADLPRLIALLAGHGYLPPSDLAWLSPGALLQWTGEMSYSSPRGTAVDLHWRLTPGHYPVQLGPEILWQNLTSIRIAGSDLPSLRPEALFLLLAVHGAKHCWESIGWLADAAWLLHANSRFDWKFATDLAAEAKCRRPLLLAVSLVRRIFDAPAPDLGSDQAVDTLQERVVARWYDGLTESPRSPELLRFAATLAERPSSILKHLLGLLFYPTEIDWKSSRLPESRFWLYAPRRAWRLAGKYLLRAPAAKTIQ